MRAAEDLAPAALPQIRPGSHVCWIVSDREAFAPIAASILRAGVEAGEKIVAFGPTGGATRRALEAEGAIGADPLADFLGGDRLVPHEMLSMFREQVTLARAEGHLGLRLVADMDWLLPSGASASDVLGFELLLDETLRDLDATVVCAYHEESFDDDVIAGTCAVHPVVSGANPAFRLVSVGPATWALSGEVDVGALDAFSSAIRAAVDEAPITLDVGGLAFIDAAGMRTLAAAFASASAPVPFRSVPAFLRRYWRLAGLDRMAPLVDAATDGAPA